MIKMVRKALILGQLESQASGVKIPETLAKISSLPGVKDTEYIAGPYDFYLIAEVDTQEELDKTVTSLRNIKSIKETMTCLVLPTKKK
jgi:hypothetical protein